jgi:hypothetical protein
MHTTIASEMDTYGPEQCVPRRRAAELELGSAKRSPEWSSIMMCRSCGRSIRSVAPPGGETFGVCKHFSVNSGVEP